MSRFLPSSRALFAMAGTSQMYFLSSGISLAILATRMTRSALQGPVPVPVVLTVFLRLLSVWSSWMCLGSIMAHWGSMPKRFSIRIDGSAAFT